MLPRLIGLHKAKELAFFADIISAKEAEAFGLVNRVVPAGELDAFVDDWAASWPPGRPSRWPRPSACSTTPSVTLEEALDDEGAAQTVNFGTHDTAEAMAAFLEKRTPTFKGL